jgi:hypothetical protein
VIGHHRIGYINSIEALPDWQALGVGLVVDCTGRATERCGAQAHLENPSDPKGSCSYERRIGMFCALRERCSTGLPIMNAFALPHFLLPASQICRRLQAKS